MASGIRVFNMDERCVGDVLIVAFQDIVRDALTASVLDIVRFLHLSLIVPVEDVRVQDQYRKCNKVCLVC